MSAAADAVRIDSTALAVDEVLDRMLEIIRPSRFIAAAENPRGYMKVIVAKSAGFCFGVKRATTMALGAASGNGRNLLPGPHHTPRRWWPSWRKRVRVIDRVDQAGEQGAVIVRSHGVTVGEMERIADRGLGIIRCHLPFVKKAQKYVNCLMPRGYTLVLGGERENPVGQGNRFLRPAGPGPCSWPTPRSAENPRRRAFRHGCPDQPSPMKTATDRRHLSRQVCRAEVFKTICDATAVRQNEAREIAERST